MCTIIISTLSPRFQAKKIATGKNEFSIHEYIQELKLEKPPFPIQYPH